MELENKENGLLGGLEKALHFLESRNDPAESYYYWQLAGGGVDLATAFLKGVNGSDYLRPPILRLPIYLTHLPLSGRPSQSSPLELWSLTNHPTLLK